MPRTPTELASSLLETGFLSYEEQRGHARVPVLYQVFEADEARSVQVLGERLYKNGQGIASVQIGYHQGRPWLRFDAAELNKVKNFLQVELLPKHWSLPFPRNSSWSGGGMGAAFANSADAFAPRMTEPMTTAKPEQDTPKDFIENLTVRGLGPVWRTRPLPFGGGLCEAVATDLCAWGWQAAHGLSASSGDQKAAYVYIPYDEKQAETFKTALLHSLTRHLLQAEPGERLSHALTKIAAYVQTDPAYQEKAKEHSFTAPERRQGNAGTWMEITGAFDDETLSALGTLCAQRKIKPEGLYHSLKALHHLGMLNTLAGNGKDRDVAMMAVLTETPPPNPDQARQTLKLPALNLVF